MSLSDSNKPCSDKDDSLRLRTQASTDEKTLKTATLQVERKAFILTLKENPRGRFLRITEDVGGRRNSVIIPATGLDDFSKVIDSMAQTSKESPLPATGAG